MMNVNKFKEDIALQFLEEDQQNVSIDGDFRELETYDSLTGMSVLAIIKDEYDVDIPVDEYKKLNTIRELFEFVKNKKSD